MPSLTISDQTGAARPEAGLELPDVPSRLTARELIRLRVREEVARHNLARPERTSGLVELDPAEVARGGDRRAARVDVEAQAAAACRAFERNRFFLLVGGRQVERLDDTIDLSGDPEVVFLKLVPLVGG